MTPGEVASIAKHVEASFQGQELNPATVKLWMEKDFTECEYEWMVHAVDRLRAAQDFLPTTRQLLDMHRSVKLEFAEPAKAEPVPERTPYGEQAWELIRPGSVGAWLLLTAFADHKQDGARLKNLILNQLAQHGRVFQAGGTASAEMIADLENLNLEVALYGDLHADQIKNDRERLREEQEQQRRVLRREESQRRR